jgi:hypothetical protein
MTWLLRLPTELKCSKGEGGFPVLWIRIGFNPDADPDLGQTFKSQKVDSMERLDQGHLHPLLERPEANLSRPGIEPAFFAGEHSSKELFEQLNLLLFVTSTIFLLT